MKFTRSGLSALIISAFAGVISACSALGGADTNGTVVAQVTSAAAESTTLRQTIEAEATSVGATAIAAETYIMQMESVNSQLLATMRAAIPPTQQSIQQGDLGTPGLNQEPALPGVAGASTPLPGDTSGTGSTGGTQFTQVVTTDTVSDADGCAIGQSTTFSTSDTRIYIASRALNITAGVTMSADWSLEGTVVYDLDSFTIAENDDDFCLWFYIDPQSIDPLATVFTAGNWSVQLYADGAAVQAPINFTIQ